MTAAVAVLNASYEPLGSTRISRAIALVHSGKAVIDEYDDKRFIRSVGGIKLPFPKVIRLLTYVNVPFVYAEENWSKSGVLRRDEYTCGYCLTTKGTMTIDHILPRAKGGQDTWLNTVCACEKCNFLKADNFLEDTNLTLQIDPTIPMKVYLRSGKKHSKKN